MLAGEDIRASDISSVLYKKKTATESVTSSTTLQDDDELFVTLQVGKWRIQSYVSVTGAAAGDYKQGWTFSGTQSSTSRSCSGPGSAMTASNAATMQVLGLAALTEVIYGIDGTNASAISEDLFLDVTVAGVLKLQWAQGTSSGTATVLGTTSRIYATPVNLALQ